jgi:hypothetical protein
MFLGNRARLTGKPVSLTTICEPTVETMWDFQHLNLIGLHGLLGDSFPERKSDNLTTICEPIV